MQSTATQPQTYKITTSSNIVTAIKLINNTTHCSRIKILSAANPGAYYIKHVLFLRNRREKASCFLYLL